MVRTGNTRAEAQQLADAIPKGWALGDAAFVAALQHETGQRAAKVRPGRPRASEI
jgi:putative transposase